MYKAEQTHPCDKARNFIHSEGCYQRQGQGGLGRIKIGVWKISWEAVETVSVSSVERLNEDSHQGAGRDRRDTDFKAGRTDVRGK